MKIAVIGRTQLLYNTIVLLLKNNIKPAIIITAKSSPEYTKKENDFRLIAKKNNIQYLFIDKHNVNTINEVCNGYDLGISVNWPFVFEHNVLKLFRLGILNAHFGDLPKYRGNACPNWAIINGEDHVTLSFHFMEGGSLDTGRIIVQENFQLIDSSTITDVYKWAEEAIPKGFISSIGKLVINESYVKKYADANDVDSFRCFPRLPVDFKIEWNKSARDIHALIRASTTPFSGAFTFEFSEAVWKKLFIWDSRVVAFDSKDIGMPGHIIKNDIISGESWVFTGRGILALKIVSYEDGQLFLPGKKWNSIRKRLGIDFENEFYNLLNRQKS